jgi:hypothetical protein
MESILNALSPNAPITVNGLQKATGLGATALTLALVSLGGRVTAVPEGLLLAPEPTPVKEKVPAGPRGPTAKVAPRLEACRTTLLAMVTRPEGVTAKALLEASEGAFLYTDILLVAKELLASGAIQESRKGRKATWVAGN